MTTVIYVRATGIYADSRATKEILALSEIAEKVIVLAWDRTGCSAEKCSEIFRDYPGVCFRFFPQKLSGSIGMKNIGILLKWLRWINAELKLIGVADAVHACDLNTVLGTLPFVFKTGCRLVYDIYDYYADSHVLPPGTRGLVAKLENSIISRSDVTIICTEERRAQIAGSHPRKLLVIHNSPDVEKPAETEVKFDYVYCGVMNGGRLIQEILDLYPQNSDLRFLFAGSGVHAQTARQLSEQYEHFHFAGSLPYSEVLELEKQAAVFSAIYSPVSRNHQLCAPNKFYEALAFGKPVIVCEGTGIDRLVEAHGIGSVIPYDAAAFYSALRKLIQSPAQMQRIGIAARELYENEYRWSMMKDRLTECYRQLDDGRNTSAETRRSAHD